MPNQLNTSDNVKNMQMEMINMMTMLNILAVQEMTWPPLS